MKRNSLLASAAAVGLVFTLGSGAALAAPQSGDDPEGAVAVQSGEPAPDPAPAAPEPDVPANDGGDAESANSESDDPQSEPPASDDPLPEANDSTEPQSEDPASEEDPEAQLQMAPMAVAPLGAGTFPDPGDLLDPSFWWPLPTGLGTAEPDPVFKRGSSGYHDPFVVAGEFTLPNIDLLAAPLKGALQERLCSTPGTTTAIDAAVKFQTGLDLLPLIYQGVSGYSPDASEMCAEYVESLTPSEILDIVPLEVEVTMTNTSVLGAEDRVATVPYVSKGGSLGEIFVFAATSSDFPGGYFDAGEYTITAELIADATVSLPSRTISTEVDWTARKLALPPQIVSGTSTVSITMPPDLGGFPLSYTFTDEPIARLLNIPTMTVLESPAIDASWDHGVGLRVNGDGYTGTVDGHVDYTGELDSYNKYFRTDLALFKVGKLLPVETVSVELDEDFNFSHTFTDLEGADYYAVPVVSSTRFLPVPVNGDRARLQVLDVRADFDAPVLECLQETGEYGLEGSVHNNSLKPTWVRIDLNDADGDVIDSDWVAPWRTHFDINAEVPAGSYTATFSADGARSVTIEGPAVEPASCAVLVDAFWDPAEAVNECPADTAGSTLYGRVDGYGPDYQVGVTIYRDGTDEPVIDTTEVEVDEDGHFAYPVSDLEQGSYAAEVVMLYRGHLLEEQTLWHPLEVTVEACPVKPDPDKKPDEKPGKKPEGGLAKTGASVGLASAVALAAIGGGAFLRRKFR